QFTDLFGALDVNVENHAKPLPAIWVNLAFERAIVVAVDCRVLEESAGVQLLHEPVDRPKIIIDAVNLIRPWWPRSRRHGQSQRPGWVAKHLVNERGFPAAARARKDE